MRRVLVVDDDRFVRLMLTNMLEREGYSVTCAANGNEALEQYKAEPADAVILDIIMPEKEGIETIVELRRDYPDAKIIVISGGGRNSAMDYLTWAKRLGAQYTFAKPFDRTELLSAVSELTTVA